MLITILTCFQQSVHILNLESGCEAKEELPFSLDVATIMLRYLSLQLS